MFTTTPLLTCVRTQFFIKKTFRGGWVGPFSAELVCSCFLFAPCNRTGYTPTTVFRHAESFFNREISSFKAKYVYNLKKMCCLLSFLLTGKQKKESNKIEKKKSQSGEGLRALGLRKKNSEGKPANVRQWRKRLDCNLEHGWHWKEVWIR